MFFHEFIYETKRIMRQKEELFWVLLFPLILGTMFYFAFGNLNQSTENFHAIPVAVSIEDKTESQAFLSVLETLSEDGDTQLLDPTYTDLESAKQLLRDNTVRGIFQADKEITLICAPSGSSGQNSTLAIEQSILEAFFKEYKANVSVITEIVSKNPEKLSELLPLMETDASYGKELTLTSGNMDNTIQYFYNLIAMVCLYTSFAGSQIAIKNQANLSDLGARKCVAPNNKFLSVTAQFISCLLTQFFCSAINILFLVYVLKIDFGTSLPLLLLTSFSGCMMGISFGFFVGSIGRLEEGPKTAIMVCVSMFCCFFSGLMIANMRMLVESFCPLLNHINPAALISDSFLTLNIYGVTARYIKNLILLFLLTIIFIAAGCLMVRRNHALGSSQSRLAKRR